ncbi:MAG: hypothetical protein E7056_08520 [Lentisphaerae bacterium]|nr:hypothetical protein [Lentisphaerota bacterium]
MNQTNSFRARLLIIAAVMAGGFAILIFKLWHEQVHYGERYRKSISRQSVRRVRLPGLRGRILTSDYCVLADNAPNYDLVFYLQEMRRNSRRRTIENIRNIAVTFSRELNRPDSLTEEAIKRHIRITPGLPLVIYKDLSEIELARAYQLMPQMPGVGIEINPVRNYPLKSLASLVIGFTRPESADKAPDRRDFFYYRADEEGKSGAERAFDTIAGDNLIPGLRGFPGYELMQVDHLGYVSSHRLEYMAPITGNNVVLSIDSRAQKLGEELLQGKRGAMVLLNADTGEVLAMVSSPHLDISRTTPVWSKDYYRELLQDKDLPMFDRAARGAYMPGSIIKPLAALAALKDNFDPETIIECDGRSIINGARISCANRYGHGELNLLEAIERSCNDYFIELGLMLGKDKLADMYAQAGIGESTKLETGGTRGMNPAASFNSSKYKWRNYDTALISIGQGRVLVSPLQAARFTAAIANGGKLMELQLLKEVYDDRGKLIFRNQPKIDKEWNLPAGAIELVHKGMYQVVNASRGSGKSARSDKFIIYGKTGTAEVDTPQGRINNTWFTSFVKSESTNYALTVLVEEAKSGGRNCAPLAKEFFERYLSEQL